MRTASATPLVDTDALEARADGLEAAGLNGIRMVRVTLDPGAPAEARLELWFHNALHLDALVAEATAAPARPWQVLRIHGGQRVVAGPRSDQLRVRDVTMGAAPGGGDPTHLVLTVSPVGDYSSYTLEVSFDPTRLDPLFSRIDFRFRPGCFTGDCDPAWSPGAARPAVPLLDYRVRDRASFRHLLIAAMMERVPGWEPTSEADLDQTLLDLLAVTGDELADVQDRVMSEAWLGTARRRLSLVRHARLMDYHVHHGNQASTWLAAHVDESAAPFTLDEEVRVWAGHPDDPAGWIWYATRETRRPPAERTLLDPLLNTLHLYDWSGSHTALPAGATGADLVSVLPGAGEAGARGIAERIADGRLRTLVLQERLNPRTGRPEGADRSRRVLLHLEPEAEAILDPVTGRWLTRVRWRPADALPAAFAFVTRCAEGPVHGVSAFHGNVLRVHQGLPVASIFHPEGAELPPDDGRTRHRHARPRIVQGRDRGTRCRLPWEPLAWLPTPPGGEVPPRSTLRVTVESGGVEEAWDERPELVHSDAGAEEGDHFVVEVDDDGGATLRFGDGVNGRRLPPDAVVRCAHQVGGGRAGNVGRDTLVHLDPAGPAAWDAIAEVWNPFDADDGRDPEPAAEILRRVPEAYRARQLRAVTLADVRRRAEEVPGVARAVARHAWTGSWRTVQVVIDPRGTTTLAPELRAAVQRHLEAVRLMGDDLELRGPRLVPAVVEVTLCVHPDVWPGDVRAVLEQELSAGLTPDGRPGLFHPDAWSFGEPLRASAVAARVQAVPGVDRVLDVRLRRGEAAGFAEPPPEALDVDLDEIVQVESDPDHRERGRVELILKGGRR